MEQSMQMMRNNPELMRSMLRTVNPQMANNPQMEQVSSILKNKMNIFKDVNKLHDKSRNDQPSRYSCPPTGKKLFIS